MDKQKIDDLLQFAQQVLLSDEIATRDSELHDRMIAQCSNHGQIISTLSVQFAAALTALADSPEQLRATLALSAMLVNRVIDAHLSRLYGQAQPKPATALPASTTVH